MAILKVASLKINSILPMATVNMYMKFGIEIPKQTGLRPGNPVAYRRMDGQTGGQGDSSIPLSPQISLGEGTTRYSIIYGYILLRINHKHRFKIIFFHPSFSDKLH